MSVEDPRVPALDGVDYYRASDALSLAKYSLVGTDYERESNETMNITGMADYAHAWKKQLQQRFEDIDLSGKDLRVFEPAKKLGIFQIIQRTTPVDLLEMQEGESRLLIPRGTRVAEIVLPGILYPPDSEDRLTFPMVATSFDRISEYLRIHKKKIDAEMVIGLTSPEIGHIATRWGFQTSEQPFPPEVYRLFDVAIAEAPDAELNDLTRLQNQVLVHNQPQTL